MKLTNKQLVDSREAMAALNGMKLPAKTSFKVAKLTKTLNDLLSTYTDTLKKIQEEHAVKNEDGTMKVDGNVIEMADIEKFNKEYVELLEVENDVSVEQIKVDNLGDADIEPAVLFVLDWLITD